MNAEHLRDLGFQLESRALGGESGGAWFAIDANGERVLLKRSRGWRSTRLRSRSRDLPHVRSETEHLAAAAHRIAAPFDVP